MRDDDHDEPGPAVGGYRIERLVGLGGMAAVYGARRLGYSGPFGTEPSPRGTR